MSNIVCFDTNIVLWGVKRSGSQDNIDRATYLIEKCDKDNSEVIIPSIVVAEILSGVESKKHDAYITLINESFIVPPFDTKAAKIYGEMWNSNKELRKSIQSQEGSTRAKLKADCLIIATAIARNAWCIYSMDSDIKKLAEKRIEVEQLPLIPPRQKPLPIDI